MDWNSGIFEKNTTDEIIEFVKNEEKKRLYGGEDEDLSLCKLLVKVAKENGLEITSSGSLPGMDPLRTERLWEYLWAAKKTNPGLILECGGPSSIMPNLLSAKSNFVTTIDISELMVSNQKKLSAALNLPINSVVADMRNLPFLDNEFNSVVSISVIEHIKERDKAISEMYRVLKSNGTLCLTFDYSTKKYDGWYPFLSSEEVKNELEKHGFIIESKFDKEPIVIFCNSYTFGRIIARKK